MTDIDDIRSQMHALTAQARRTLALHDAGAAGRAECLSVAEEMRRFLIGRPRGCSISPTGPRRSATASRSSGRMRMLETKSLPIGWTRSPHRPHSSCPVCWGDLTHLAWVDACGTELLGDRGDL